MNMPETMPPLLQIEAGLNVELEKEKVVFEKYIQTRMGNAEANRLYANGDLYKIYLSSNQSLKKDSITWRKAETISKNDLNKIQKISKNSVINYLSKSPKRVTKAVENINWYFYFDEPLFVQSQVRQWRRSPKFARKINKILE